MIHERFEAKKNILTGSLKQKQHSLDRPREPLLAPDSRRRLQPRDGGVRGRGAACCRGCGVGRSGGRSSLELLLGALGADDVVGVGDEAPAHKGRLAGRADEAVVVPVAVLEGDEARAADACKAEGRQ